MSHTPDARRSHREDADIARAELRDTLGQLTERLNYAKRIDTAVHDTTQRLQQQKARHPFAFTAGAVAVAAAVGVATWALTSAIFRNKR